MSQNRHRPEFLWRWTRRLDNVSGLSDIYNRQWKLAHALTEVERVSSLRLQWQFRLRRRQALRRVKEGKGNAILQAGSLVTLMELGDKTQFTSFVLAARYGNPLMVFAGIMLGSALITGSGVVIGKAIMRFVPERYLRYIAAALFLIFGAIFLASALMGIEIL